MGNSHKQLYLQMFFFNHFELFFMTFILVSQRLQINIQF